MTQSWRISIGFGEATVRADGWLDALARGLPELGLDVAALGQLSIEPLDDGGAIARDVVTELEIRIEPVDAPPGFVDMPTPSIDAVGRRLGPDEDADPYAPPTPRSLPPGVVGSAAGGSGAVESGGFGAAGAGGGFGAAGAGGTDRRAADVPPHAPSAPAPNVGLDATGGTPGGASTPVPPPADPALPPYVPDERTMEAGELVQAGRFRGLPDDVVEDLFLRLGEISTAGGVAAASGIALRILLDFVPAGAGAVLIRTRAGDGLRFRAASGPAAGRLVDTVIPLDRGIAGFVCQLGVALSVADARRDRRHDARVDKSTGYTTRGMLAVPVRADSGAIFGCIELLNPPRPYNDEDVQLAARVAASLGTFLQSVYAVR